MVQKLVSIGEGGKMRADLLAEKFVCLQTKIRLNTKINRFTRFFFCIAFLHDGVCLPK